MIPFALMFKSPQVSGQTEPVAVSHYFSELDRRGSPEYGTFDAMGAVSIDISFRSSGGVFEISLLIQHFVLENCGMEIVIRRN
jgi:hypothetical protein